MQRVRMQVSAVAARETNTPTLFPVQCGANFIIITSAVLTEATQRGGMVQLCSLCSKYSERLIF